MTVKRQGRDWLPFAMVVTFVLFAVFAVFVLVRSVASDGGFQSEQRVEDCESDYGYLLQIESYGDSSQNSHLWEDFRADCDDQVGDLTEYVAARATARAAGNDCALVQEQVGAQLLELLESYGECDGVPLAEGYEAADLPAAEPSVEAQNLAVAEPTAWPGGDAIGWAEAAQHVGTAQRVCGPLISARRTDDGTFVNVGRDYPSADRFTFVFWDIHLNPIDSGVTVCGSGEIYLYDGTVAQMEMWDPSALEIW